jgi:hypothetical protein
MKRIMIFAIIAILLLIVVLIPIAMNKSYQAEQIAQQQYETELNAKLQSQAEQIAKLQAEVEQSEKNQFTNEDHMKLQNILDKYEEAQYRVMCLTIEKNSDYLERFSKKCLFKFEEYGYDVNFGKGDIFDLRRIEDIFDVDFNIELLRKRSFIRNVRGVIVVQLEYAGSIEFYYSSDFTNPSSYDCSVIYVPDEYLNEESIEILQSALDSLEHITDNLFVAKHSRYDY